MLARAGRHQPPLNSRLPYCAISSAILSLKAERSLDLRPVLSLP
jgi:hypothetical protein